MRISFASAAGLNLVERLDSLLEGSTEPAASLFERDEEATPRPSRWRTGTTSTSSRSGASATTSARDVDRGAGRHHAAWKGVDPAHHERRHPGAGGLPDREARQLLRRAGAHAERRRGRRNGRAAGRGQGAGVVVPNVLGARHRGLEHAALVRPVRAVAVPGGIRGRPVTGGPWQSSRDRPHCRRLAGDRAVSPTTGPVRRRVLRFVRG
jgi:hypothetical protein